MSPLVRRLSAVVFVLRGARGGGGARENGGSGAPSGGVARRLDRAGGVSVVSAGLPTGGPATIRVCRGVAVVALTLGTWLAVSAAPASASFRYPLIRQLSPFNFAFGSAVNNATGQTLVADSGGGKVQVYDASGNHVATWDGSAANNSPGTPSRSFGGGDIGVAANDTTGTVYVADSQDHVVDILSSSGGYVSQITGPTGGSFGFPVGIAVDQATGDVFVADTTHNVIDVFTADGGFLRQISAAGTPVAFSFFNIFSLAVDPTAGHLFIADGHTNEVYEFTTAGSYLTTLTGAGTPQGSFGCGLEGVGVRNSDEHLFVTSACGGRGAVDEFDNTGSYVNQISSTPSGPLPTTTTGVSIDQATGDELVATNGAVDIFGPGAMFPDVTTGQATNVTPSSATLNGTVNPDGVPVTDCHFDYGTSTSYGQSVPCVEAVGSGSAPVPVHADVSGLTSGATYHFRLVAANANGPTDGNDVQFGPATVDRSFADTLTPTGATLRAGITPNGLATTYHFEYGTTSAYGQSTPESPSIGSDRTDHPVSDAITGLATNTTYHFRVVATNASGVTDGPDQTLTTTPPALVDVQPPTGMATSTGLSNGTATLHAYIDPQGSDTTYHFEYGTTSAYGSSTPSQGAGAGNISSLQSAQIGGLAAGTMYHYRTVASNTYGTYDGPDSTFTTPPSSCPNQQFRTGLSARLPDCRAFEQVSPVDKGGYPAAGPLVAASGERVSFTSNGVFAGDPIGYAITNYLSQRGASGWSTAGVDPPATLGVAGGASWSADLTESARSLRFASTQADAPTATSGAFFIRRLDGSFVQASPTLTRTDGSALLEVAPTAASADLSHEFFFDTLSGLFGAPLLPGVPTTVEYEVVGAGGPSPVLRVASIDPNGNPIADTRFTGGCPASPSRDGSIFIFGCGQIYARVDGQSTVAISQPSPNDGCTTSACQSSPVQDALFAGMSADASKVFFISAQQKTDDATGGSNNLYEYDFNRPAGHNLLDLSAGDVSGQGPQVQTVLRVSADGSHAYFIAHGVLTSEPNSLGQLPRAGAENLYVADAASGSVSFVAELCTGTGQSGSVSGVAQCPGSGNDTVPVTGLGLPGALASDVTPDGRFLVFTSYGQLTPDDTDAGASVFEYDALTGSLVRVSVGHDGQDQNGNDGHDTSAVDQGTHGHTSVAPEQSGVTDDGQTVILTTAAPLQTSDVNGASDVYEWHQGEVRLVSDGQSPNGASGSAITPSGQDIVFDTDIGLLPQDTDGLADVYDARIGGGFPAPAAGITPCSGDGCQGQPSGGPAPPTAASVSFFGPGNASAGSSPVAGKARVLTRTVHGWRFVVRVRVPGAGRITITGGAIKRTSRLVRTAGSYGLRVVLTARERAALRHKRRLRLMLHVSYTPAGGSASAVTFPVTVRA